MLAATHHTVPGAKTVAVYVATTRARDVPHQNVFRSGRADKVNFAEFRISVPPNLGPAKALDETLSAIEKRYGRRTTAIVAMQLEYPRRAVQP